MTKPKLYVDLETYCDVNLKTTNVYRYAESPEFDILMAGFAYQDEPVELVTGGSEAVLSTLREAGLFDDRVLKVAHNAQFDRVCLSTAAGVRYLAPETFHDTMAVAAERGLPQDLDTLAKVLKVSEKDSAGKALIRYFCQPYRGVRRQPEDSLERWLDFGMYCVQDVDTLREVDKVLGDFPTEAERALYHADQRINDRGIKLDIALARAANAAAVENKENSVKALARITGVANPNSRDQLLAWVRSRGVLAPNLVAETVKGLLEGDLPDDVREALLLRQRTALTSSSKFEAALRHVSPDHRLRGQFKFFGAHTGRWAGRGVQLQNLARAALPDDTAVEAAIADLHMGFGADDVTLKKLVRPSLIGPFGVSDYSAIEARVVAWLAGEQWVIDAFANGRDIYVETAEKMGGLTRFQGKVAVLALGYNGGVNSLINLAGGEEHLLAGMTLEEAQANPEELKAKLLNLVRQWRKQNSQIVRYWTDLERAFIAGRGNPGAGFITVERVKNDRLLRLPSGRAIHYRSVSTKQTEDQWGRPKTEISFADNQYGRATTYGGRLVENVTQAVARDVLGAALVAFDTSGLPVVGHVHDEVLVELPDGRSVDEVSAIMTRPPEWARGLPLDSEGYTTYRYRKG